MSASLLMTLCSAQLAAAAGSRADAPARLVVIDIIVERRVDDSLVRLLNEMLLTEFVRRGHYEVIGGSDVKALLDIEQQKQLIDCTDSGCLAEIGGALGGDYLAIASLGKVGSFFLFHVKVIDVRAAVVLARFSEKVEADEDKLVDSVLRSVSEIVAQIAGTQSALVPASAPEQPAKASDIEVRVAAPTDAVATTPTVKGSTLPTATREASQPAPAREQPAKASDSTVAAAPTIRGFTLPTERREASQPAPSPEEPVRGWLPPAGIAPIALWGAGAVGLGIGIAFGVKAQGHLANAIDPGFVGSQLADREGRTSELVANVGYAAGAASAVAGLLVWLLWPRQTEGVVAVPAVTGSSAGLTFIADL